MTGASGRGPDAERRAPDLRMRSRPKRGPGWPLLVVAVPVLVGLGWGAVFALRALFAGESPRAAGTAAPPPATSLPAPPSSASAQVVVPAPLRVEPVEVASAAPDDDARPEVMGPLTPFFHALHALKNKRRREPVRILWLGDSHTYADFWPDAVRRPLAARFGGGGPGFLFTGMESYRHAGARLHRQGEWVVAPDRPSLPQRQADGVFGLGGMRATLKTPDSRLDVDIDREGLRGDAVWDLCFRLPTARSGFRVTGDGMKPILVDAATYPTGRLAHVTWRTPAPARVTIDGADGDPELCGLVVEGSLPGVVLDSTGIIGARIGTPLSWEAAPWIAEAKRRKPTLAVLAFGTNESGDGVPVSSYAAQYKAMMGRVRAASPEAVCVIVGPTDRVVALGSPGRVREITLVQQQSAAALGCAFFSTQEAMGGEGGFTKWAAVDGEFTSADGVHLMPNGYSELGAQMVRVLLSERPGLK